MVYIQTSQAEMILNNQFDTIYHEHVSFFNINSMNELVKRTNLTLADVIKTPVHGISYLFRFTKSAFEGRRKVFNEIEVERQRGLLSKKTYDEYTKNIMNLVSEFKELVQNSKREGFKLVGYGAAAKGMTFLNFADVELDTIIDDNELKQELYTPGTNILIKSNEHLKTYLDTDKILFIPLAWNFYDEIRDRILKTRENKNDWFLRYFQKLNWREDELHNKYRYFVSTIGQVDIRKYKTIFFQEDGLDENIEHQEKVISEIKERLFVLFDDVYREGKYEYVSEKKNL